MSQIETIHKEQASSDFSILCELLKDYIALIGAARVSENFRTLHKVNIGILIHKITTFKIYH